MKALGWAWFVLQNLLALLFVLGILLSGASPFEKLVLALLVLIYLSVGGGLATVEYSLLVGNLASMRRDSKVLRTVGEKDAATDVDSAVTEAEDALSPNAIRYYIASVFRWLGWLMAVVAIVSAFR